MVKIRKQEIVTFSFKVGVTGKDIEEGKCRDPHRCMERIAIQRALEALLGDNKVDRLRLDGAQDQVQLRRIPLECDNAEDGQKEINRLRSQKASRPAPLQSDGCSRYKN